MDGQKISKTSAITLTALSVCILLTSTGCVITSSILKETNSDIPDDIFIIWAGIPGIFVGIVGIVAAILKNKHVIMLFFVLAVLTLILLGIACVINGLAYWSDGWSNIKQKAENCNDTSSVGCTCITPPKDYKDSKCEDLEKIAELIVAQSSIAAVTAIIILITCFVASSLVFCTSWNISLDIYSSTKRKGHHPPPQAQQHRPQYPSQHGYLY